MIHKPPGPIFMSKMVHKPSIIQIWYSIDGDNVERFFFIKLLAVKSPNSAPKIDIHFPSEDK